MSTTRTWKRIEVRRSGQFRLLAVALTLAGVARPSAAVVGAQLPAAILVYPEIRFDSSKGQDTLFELANTRTDQPVTAHCFYVRAIGQCSVSLATCLNDADCPSGQHCMGQWTLVDFVFQMTPGQVVGWQDSVGLSHLPLLDNIGIIPPAASDPFLGEMICVEVSNFADNPSQVPVARNDLIGTATLTNTNGPDVASYTAIGIPAVGPNNGDQTLCLGGDGGAQCPTAEYAACPEMLSLNHFFDRAVVDGASVQTSLVLVPCSADFELQEPSSGTVNFVSLDEFEIPFGFSTPITCWSSIPLDVPSPIFSAALRGSTAAQLRIAGQSAGAPMPLLGVAVETYSGITTGLTHQAAHNLTASGPFTQVDVINLPTINGP